MTFTSSKPLPPTRRLYREISEQIRSQIESGVFALGTRLPAERDLSELFDVSRSSVREALIVLEINGYVDIRGGSGVYVCNKLPTAPGAAALWSKAAGMGPFEIMETRLLLEPECAALAALHATPEQRDMLRNDHAAMEMVQNDDLSREGGAAKCDRLLHATIAQFCGNAALESSILHLWDLSDHSPVFQRLDAQYVTAQDWRVAWVEHGRFVEAIASGDATRARQAMAYHLLAVIERLRENPGWIS